MSRRGKRVWRAIRDIMLEVAGVVVLAAFLSGVQSTAAVRRQESNSQANLRVAVQRLERDASEAGENLNSYDSFSQAKVDSIAYFLDNTPGYADVAGLAKQWGLDCYLLLNDNHVVLQSSGEPAPESLGALLEWLRPVKSGEYRYYAAKLTDGGWFVGGRNVTAEMEAVVALRAPASALGSLRVGTDGYVFAVRRSDGVIAYHPQKALVGRSAAECGYDPATYADGYNGWLRLGEQRFYCVSQAAGSYLLAAVVPEAELLGSARRLIAVAVLAFCLVITLVIAYAILLRHDLEEHHREPTRRQKIGKRLYLDVTIAGKIRNVALIGLVAVFAITFYAQTLLSLSRQSQLSKAKLEAVAHTLEDNDRRVEALTAEYSEEYAQRARNIAYVLRENRALLREGLISGLADSAQVSAVYVFNRQGRVVATNTPYKDFVLSADEADQSYPFWSVAKGYTPLLVQEARRDDTMQHNYVQYVGVQRLDSDGMVELGLSPRRLESRLQTTQLDYVLREITVENEGYLFAADSANGTLLSYPTEKAIGRPAAQYGLTEAALADGYFGHQRMDGQDVFVSSMEHNGQVISMAVPLSVVYDSRGSMALWVTLVSLAILLALTCLLVFRTGDDADEPAASDEPAPTDARYFAVTQVGGGSRMVQSAASRWSGTHQPWREKTPEQKMTHVTGLLLSAAALALVAYLWISKGTAPRGSLLGFILGREWEKGVNIFSLTYAGIVLLETLVITGLARRLLLFATQRFGARSETVGRLLDSFLKYAAVIVAVFYCLGALGVDSTALITSAGILSLVVGLGAQSLIGDILAGIFIVFEGEFRVGDIVTIGDWRGTVREIGIRTTKVESAGSDIKIFSNSAISGVVNMTKQYSYAFADIGIEYGESLERVESVLDKELPLIRKHLPAIVDGPFYKGVASLGESSVNIRIVAQCKEDDRIQLTRDLNREFKLLFDRYDINIPFPQVVVNQPSKHAKATRSEKKEAAAFVQEQEELSRTIQARDDG